MRVKVVYYSRRCACIRCHNISLRHRQHPIRIGISGCFIVLLYYIIPTFPGKVQTKSRYFTGALLNTYMPGPRVCLTNIGGTGIPMYNTFFYTTDVTYSFLESYTFACYNILNRICNTS